MSDSAVDRLRSALIAPHPDTAPMMRWWWFSGIERDELGRELEAMAAAGIGGVEVAFVYAVDIVETTAAFCSPEQLADLRWAAERAAELGLRFDLTLGSGWSYGGGHIGAEHAARGLRWDQRDLGGEALEVDLGPGWPGDDLVAAYLVDGADGEPQDARPLGVTPSGTGWRVTIPVGGGPRRVLLAWSRLTGQQVKRAAVGAEGPVLDHYSADATRAHLRAVADPMLDAVPAQLLGSVFCDSLEVYGSDWTPDLPQEFERRRGYPLLPELPLLLVRRGEQAHRLRSDVHRTLTDLYEERFVAVMQSWSAGRGVPFRLQGYGTPPAALSSYRFADAFEGEGWGWTELTATRWASSAAHHYGRDVVSAEAWTWVHSPSFRATPLDLVGEAHEHLLGGVTLLIGHGWPCSPADAEGLGWFFYAAGCLDDRNPWWPVMGEVTRYLGRLSWLLRQGVGVADVAVYVPTADLLAEIGRGTGGDIDLWRTANRTIGPDVLGPIVRSGLDYRLFDDDVVEQVAPAAPAVVLVPAAQTLPEPTRTWLESAAASGTTVLTIGSTAEVVGARAVTTAELGAALATATEIPFVDAGEIGMVHRRIGELDVRVLINTTAIPQRTTVRLQGAWQRWDARTLATTQTGSGDAVVGLEPYEATVLVSAPGEASNVPSSGTTTALAKGWTVTFADEQPRSVALPHRWEDELEGYSGAATYRIEVDLPPTASATLDLGEPVALDEGASPQRGIVGPSYRAALRGPVGEVASVRVNGVECGTAWAPPYRVDVGEALQPGANTIEITVYNTAANTLAVDDSIAPRVARAEARYGRRFVFQELDKALDGVSSGLLAVPTLTLSPAPSSAE